MEKQLITGAFVSGSTNGLPEKLAENISFYLQWHRIEGHSPKTLVSYEEKLGNLRDWLIAHGVQSVPDITAFHLLSYLDSPKAHIPEEEREKGGRRPWKDRSKRSHYVHIRAWLNWCVEWDLIEEKANPIRRVKPPGYAKERKPYLRDPEIERVLELCPPYGVLGLRKRCMVMLFLSTGMRVSEMAGLQIADIDFEREMVRIRRGKGAKERWVPLEPEVKRLLFRYIHIRKDSCPALWVSRNHKRGYGPLTLYGINQLMGTLLKAAGIEYRDACHIFRRTWAIKASKQRINRQYIKTVGGWSTMKMIDLYTESMGAEEEALEAFRGFAAF